MTVQATRLAPFFLTAPAGRLHCQYVAPLGAARGGVLYVHPFAEESNKSRRMAIEQARALAAEGWGVLMPDLTGCGDSSGDFGDATWQVWLDDIALARNWLQRELPQPIWFWGLRLGALLAGELLAAEPANVQGLLLWQPVLSGRQQLQQFLRLKSGAEWVAGAAASTTGAALPGPLQILESGRSVEVAGYSVHPQLAAGMSLATLALPPATCRLACFEVNPNLQPELTPAIRRWLSTEPTRLNAVVAAVQGPSFWQTQEIEMAPSLIDATTRIFAA